MWNMNKNSNIWSQYSSYCILIYILYLHLAEVFVVSMLYFYTIETYSMLAICCPLTQHVSTSVQTILRVLHFLFCIFVTYLVYLPIQAIDVFRQHCFLEEMSYPLNFVSPLCLANYALQHIVYICHRKLYVGFQLHVIYPAADNLFGTSLLQCRAEKKAPCFSRGMHLFVIGCVCEAKA